MNRRNLFGIVKGIGKDVLKQQAITRTAPGVPIQLKRATIDSIDTLQQLGDKPNLTRRALLRKMADKIAVRHFPTNTDESAVHWVEKSVKALKNTNITFMAKCLTIKS